MDGAASRVARAVRWHPADGVVGGGPVWTRERALAIGARFAEARRAAGLKQADVAERLRLAGIRVHQGDIGRLERGTASAAFHANPRFLAEAAAILGVDPLWLVDAETPRRP
jgi:transcriptional regulator with XRE-family HTH domain